MTETSGNSSNGHRPAWNEILLGDFTGDDIGLRPQITCKGCRDHRQRCCGQEVFGKVHKVEWCDDCKQKLTTAHMHLSYVGHAALTRRLLDADPLWYWRPLYREIDPDILKAALATGDQGIIKSVLDSFPPRFEEFPIHDSSGRLLRTEKGMWIELVLHDGDGNEVIMQGFGDAKGKTSWEGDTLKEIIGDALRNAGMRRGAALALWLKQERERTRKEIHEALPPQSASAAAAAAFAGDADGQDAKPSGPDKALQALADLAWAIVSQAGTVKERVDLIKASCYDKVTPKRNLGAMVHPPWSENPDERIRLTEAFTHCKNVIETRARTAEEAPA